MHLLKKLFTATTGYWIHKLSTLPIGADLFMDIHNRIKYGPLNNMFDVGANRGQTWEWFRHNEPGAHIYCFEPVASTFAELERTTVADKNCTIENIAFGNNPGEKTIKLFGNEHSALNSLKDELMNWDVEARTERINVDSIDNYCSKNGIKRIDFLKIDTEGYELEVLEGASRMLDTASISFVYCEIGFMKKNNRNTNFGELTEWLATKDYLFYGLYQLVTNGWREGDYFGNALYVHKDIFKP